MPTYKDRTSLVLSHRLMMQYRAPSQLQEEFFWVKSERHEAAMFLFLLRAREVRNVEQRRGKVSRWFHGHVSWSRAGAGVLSPPEGSHFEWGECRAAEHPLEATPPRGQRALPKTGEGFCPLQRDTMLSRAPSTAGASGHCSSCQIKSNNHQWCS